MPNYYEYKLGWGSLCFHEQWSCLEKSLQYFNPVNTCLNLSEIKSIAYNSIFY